MRRSLDPFRNWGAYLKIAVPGLAMICLEWWTYEVGAGLILSVSLPFPVSSGDLASQLCAAYCKDLIALVMLQVIVIMAGLLPDSTISVAVMGVSFDITTITYMLPAGIGGEQMLLSKTHLTQCRWLQGLSEIRQSCASRCQPVLVSLLEPVGDNSSAYAALSASAEIPS